jgi:hypothetical protein
MGVPSDEQQALIRRAYEVFNRHDIDAAVAMMHPDVDWPNGWEGGRVTGREAVRAYCTRQFAAIDPHVEPEGMALDDERRVVVDVHQVVRDPNGNLLGDGRLQHIYTIRDGMVERMDIRESRDE